MELRVFTFDPLMKSFIMMISYFCFSVMSSIKFFLSFPCSDKDLQDVESIFFIPCESIPCDNKRVQLTGNFHGYSFPGLQINRNSMIITLPATIAAA